MSPQTFAVILAVGGSILYLVSRARREHLRRSARMSACTRCALRQAPAAATGVPGLASFSTRAGTPDSSGR